MKDQTNTPALEAQSTNLDGPVCPNCNGALTWEHDHIADQSGLDDGPWLPGWAPRKKRVIHPETFSAERKRGWETRRAKYGQRGHR